MTKVIYFAGSIYVKDTSTKGTSIESFYIRKVYTIGTYLEDAYTRSTYIGVKSFCTDSTCVKDTYTRVTFDKDIYVKSFYTIKHSKIYLQSFQNLEVRDTGLEI